MKFTWDENKNVSNIEKHGISFEQCILLFPQEEQIKERKKYMNKRDGSFGIMG